MLLSRIVRVAVTALALAPLSGAGTLTVGPAGSGAQFTQIQAAIDAALPNDVILVKPGTYARIDVAKPLRILGDGTGLLRVSGSGPVVTIRSIGAGAELVLSGVEVAVTDDANVILLEDCPGTVVLEDLTVPDALVFDAGILVDSCARALLLDSDVRSSYLTGAVRAQDSELWIANSRIKGLFANGFLFFGAAPGVSAVNSTIHVWRSQVLGGGADGVFTSPKFGDAGGAGIEARGSTVNLFGGPGSQITGGMGPVDGGIDWDYPGGPGLTLLQTSRARIQDDIPIQGGFNGSFAGQAPAIRVDSTSTATLDPKVYPTLVSSAQQVRIGSSFGLTKTGNPGGYQVMFLSVRTGPTWTARGVDGFGLLDRGNLIQLATDVLSASGTHTTNFRVPNAAALLGTTLFFQTAERFPNSPSPGFAIGNPVLVTITL